MKKSFISVLVIGFTLSGISAFAEEGVTGTAVAVPTMYTMTTAAVPTTPAEVVVPMTELPSSVSPITERAEIIVGKTNIRIQARGAQLIKERINSLNQNAEAVAKSKLTVDQKAAFAAFFNGKVVELNALGTKIASSTEASSTKALVSSIFTDFRIYAVVIPQIRLEKRIYEVQNHIAKLTEVFAKIQVNIDAQKAKGKDVTVWQKALDDAKALVAADTAKLAALATQINALKPADYPTTSKTTIETVNKGVRSVVLDLNTIGKKVRKPLYFKNMSVNENSSALSLTSWTWTTSNNNGVATTSPEGGKFVLSFTKDKRMHSSTDCNTLGSSYNLDGDKLSFGPMMSTRMFCEGSKEGVYSETLAKIASYKIEGSTLTLVGDKVTMTFVKKN